MASEQPAGEEQSAESIVESAQYKHLVQAFDRATGLGLHAYSVEDKALTDPVDPPAYCQTLQSAEDCPLLFDPRYHRATVPEIRNTCGGIGHVVIPVLDTDGRQVLNLVSASARFGPVDMDQVVERAFRLKIVPDELAEQAEGVPAVARDRLMFAAQILFAGLHELAGGQPDRTGALEILIHHVAAAPPADIPLAILDALLEVSGAELAYLVLLDDQGVQVAEGTTLKSTDGWWRILKGVGRWVVHMEQPIDMPDISESAWCRHMAGSPPPPAGVYGVPLVRDGKLLGAVVAGADIHKESWRDAVNLFMDTCGDAMLLCRRLVETGEGGIVDRRTGAYNLNVFEELLDREISRAGRYNHDLSVVLFHLANYGDLVSELGARGAEEVVGQMVELLQGKTRKVNFIARVTETDFALVVPEADHDVAERIADELQALAQTSAFGSGPGGTAQVTVKLRTRTVSNPSAVDSAIEDLNSPN